MLPPGHIAAGYISSKALLKILPYNFSGHQNNLLILLGMLFSFAPDLDMFYGFIKISAFRIDNKRSMHRGFISHAPLIWLLAGLTIFLLYSDPFYKTIGLLIWTGSWTHFILDSIQCGIMWLWPLNHKLYYLLPIKDQQRIEAELEHSREGFLGYWWHFVKLYIVSSQATAILEMLLIFFAILLSFK